MKLLVISAFFSSKIILSWYFHYFNNFWWQWNWMAYNINPFQTNVSLLYPLKHQKTAGSWWFLVVGELNGFMFSRGIEVEHLYRKARGSNNACPNASPHFFTKTIKLLRVFSQDLFYFLNICFFFFFFFFFFGGGVIGSSHSFTGQPKFQTI